MLCKGLQETSYLQYLIKINMIDIKRVKNLFSRVMANLWNDLRSNQRSHGISIENT